MLFEPTRTEYDLNFRILGVDVRVHPLFWLISAILGWGSMNAGFSYLLMWIACVFVSILIHEMGHVMMGRLFGSDGYIVLYSFGGLAIGSSDLRQRWKRILVYAAGPGAQFVLLAVIVGCIFLSIMQDAAGGIMQNLGNLSPLVGAALSDLIWINLFWPILNLFPIWPLDGGKISREILEAFMGEKGTRASLGLSMLVAGLIAVNALSVEYGGKPIIPFLWLGDLYIALLFGMMAYNNYQELQMLSYQQRQFYEDDDSWRR